MIRINLEAGSFISYEGIARDGHWNPGGADAEDAQGVISEFRKRHAAAGLGASAHEKIVEFDFRTLRALNEDAYTSTGYFPQLTWMALERSGLWSAMNELCDGSEASRLHGQIDHAGLILPNGLFKMAVELVAGSQKIDWNYRTSECGGHNLLFLYAGNVVSKVYPAYLSRNNGLLIESFVFDPALVPQT